jgi:hypothetical protein
MYTWEAVSARNTNFLQKLKDALYLSLSIINLRNFVACLHP